jgi:hypothetical protein
LRDKNYFRWAERPSAFGRSGIRLGWFFYYFGKGRAEDTTKIVYTQIFEHKNEVNRILFYTEGTILILPRKSTPFFLIFA